MEPAVSAGTGRDGRLQGRARSPSGPKKVFNVAVRSEIGPYLKVLPLNRPFPFLTPAHRKVYNIYSLKGAVMSLTTRFICFVLLLMFSLPVCSHACEMRIGTEYRYPTDYEVTPVMGRDKNGQPIIIGGIVTPKNFQTRFVGTTLHFSSFVGHLAGAEGVGSWSQGCER